MCNIKFLHPYSAGVFLVNHWVLADVIANPRIIIPEPVVIEARLIVLILSQLSERNEVTDTFYVSKVTINIIVSLPNNVAIAVVRFHRATHIVADNRVAFTVLYLCHRNVRAFLINPCDKVIYRLFALHTDTAELVNAMLRSVLLLILPLLHHHVAVPKVTEDVTIKEFCCATPKSIILDMFSLSRVLFYLSKFIIDKLASIVLYFKGHKLILINMFINILLSTCYRLQLRNSISRSNRAF